MSERSTSACQFGQSFALASLLLSQGREVYLQDGSVLLKAEHEQNPAHHHSIQFATAHGLMGGDL